MKKCKVNCMTGKGAVTVDGYGFEATLRDPGTGKPTASVWMGVHRTLDGSGWAVTCPCTGKVVATGRTRKEAESQFHVVFERYEAMYFTEEFAKMRMEFGAAVRKLYGRMPLGEVKVTDSNGEEVAASVEPKTVEVRKDKPEPPREDIEDTATEVSLESMLEWARDKNVAVCQKNPNCQIKVLGDTEPYEEELKDMGFRQASRKRFWWLKVA